MSTTSATGPSYDPASTASALATQYTSGQQNMLTTQTKLAQSTATALSSLKSAISTFQARLTTLTAGKTMLSQAATLSDAALGSASAKAGATAGSYAFYVEKLATAHQVSFGNLDQSPPAGGSLGIELGGALAFSVVMSAADTDGVAGVSARELAAAINAAAGNAGKVAASIITLDGKAQLVLTAKATGTANAISLATGTLDSAGALDPADPAAAIKQLVAADNAVLWLGAQTSGTRIEQASNTFTGIDDVTLTFSKAQALGAPPVTLTVGTDSAATTANVQRFIDAYNTLKKVLDGLTAPGNPSAASAPGAFAGDSGIKVLRDRLIGMLRPASGDNLALYGVTAARDGSLVLNQTQLEKTLALRPNGLDQLIGSSAIGTPSGLAGSLDTYLKQWSSSAGGQLTERLASNAKLQVSLTSRQDQLDKQYNSAYQRYLIQFTKLQTLQSQMASNTSMFDALFGDKSK